jgi:hypothetical protein
MKNKNKKFKSLKSVLVLLQQLQVTHLFKKPISVDVYCEDKFVSVTIFFKNNESVKTVYFHQSDTESDLKEKYLKVIEILKME